MQYTLSRHIPTAHLTICCGCGKCVWPCMPSLVGWPRIASLWTLQKLNSSGWVIVGVWRMSTMVLWLTFSRMPSSLTLRDLGIVLEQELSFSQHFNHLTRSCYYQLRQLRTISRSWSHAAAATLVHAFFTIRLDHCCSVFVALPLALLTRLFRVLRSAARLNGHVHKLLMPLPIYGIPWTGFLPLNELITE